MQAGLQLPCYGPGRAAPFRVAGPAGQRRSRGHPAGAIQSRNCRRRRRLEQNIIASRRSNSAHLHRPWRASQIRYLPKITV
jgi:hypothetical protein